MSQKFYSLKVSDKRAETADSASFLFEISDNLKSEYSFTAGQYLTLKVNIGGNELRRAYSIFTAPFEKQFGCTVKRLKGGKVSNYLIDNINVGDSLEVMVPEGKFVLDAHEGLKRDHYFIAGGSGITPVMSMIKTVLENEPLSRAYLIYSNRNESSIIFKDELDQLSEKYKNQLFVRHILSQPHKEKLSGLKGLLGKTKTNWQGWSGRLDANRLQLFLDENPSVSNEAHYYLCGPGGLITNAEMFLKNRGVDAKSLHKEYFTSADLDSGEKAHGESSDCKAKVTLNGEEFEVEIPKGKTVLEALLDRGKDAPYSCTSGACSTCVARVISGEVEMDACFALDEEEIKSGHILTCQARALTPELELVFES